MTAFVPCALTCLSGDHVDALQCLASSLSRPLKCQMSLAGVCVHSARLGIGLCVVSESLRLLLGSWTTGT